MLSTPSNLYLAKVQKNLKADVKGREQAVSDFGVVTRFVIENNRVLNENGVLSGNANYLILQCQFLDLRFKKSKLTIGIFV